MIFHDVASKINAVIMTVSWDVLNCIDAITVKFTKKWYFN